MNGQERFLYTLTNQKTDRPPLFDDGIRREVLKKWRSQGLGRNSHLEDLFSIDKREEIEPNLELVPAPTRWPTTLDGLTKLAQRLDAHDPRRLPGDWTENVAKWRTRDYPLILRVHRGYFLTMGVYGWHRFTDAIRLLIDSPYLVHTWLDLYAEFIGALVDLVLSEIAVDAVLFSEPIGGNNGPLISPKMYSSFVLNSYRPILNIVKSHGVGIMIFRTYANTRALLPLVVEAGFNCLWACECNPTAMDYREIRREFGKDLKLIGGIDSDALRSNTDKIDRVFLDTVRPLLQDGGYIPLADGRVREDVSFENYAHYRKSLEMTAITG